MQLLLCVPFYICTFAPAKVRIALALCHQYSDKEQLNLQLRRSEDVSF